MTAPPLKKALLWVLLIFVLYSIFTNPTAAAAMFGNAWQIILGGISNVGRFFDALINR